MAGQDVCTSWYIAVSRLLLQTLYASTISKHHGGEVWSWVMIDKRLMSLWRPLVDDMQSGSWLWLRLFALLWLI